MKAGIAVSPEFELIVPQPDQSFRWFTHDYPYPIFWGYHPEYELHLLRESQGILFCGDYVGEFAPGNLCLIGPNVPHQWVSNISPGATIRERDVVAHFLSDQIDGARRFLPEFVEIIGLLDDAKRGIEFTGKAAKAGGRLFLELGAKRGLQRLLGFVELLLVLARSKESDRKHLASANYRTAISAERAGAVVAIISYVVDNLAGEIRLSRAAEATNMSEPSMSRFFKRTTGIRFTEYVRKLRIGLACRLLAETDREIVAISSEAGYENLSNFNRAFLQEKGMTPSKYRKSVRLLCAEKAALRHGRALHSCALRNDASG